jgi:hypothetical protein
VAHYQEFGPDVARSGAEQINDMIADGRCRSAREAELLVRWNEAFEKGTEMTVVKLSDYVEQTKAAADPVSTTFFGARFRTLDGKDGSLNIPVKADDGDVARIQEEGGVGDFHNGQYYFLPYPCACVVTHRQGEQPFKTQEDADEADEAFE